MLRYPEIPLTLIRDLLCRHCKKFVTCGPIHVVPDGSVLCGRCRMLAKPTYRNHAYETIAKCFVYPCCYWSKHCSKILHWNESLEHERNCVYNTSVRLLCSHPTAVFRSKRKIPELKEQTLEHISENALDQLKCMNCDGYLSCDPVYIRNDGKSICHRCITSNGIPPYCIRNLSYERLASFIIFPCIYRHRGCPTRLKYGRDLWQHETECPYGQIHRKPARQLSKNGKERGVIQTHSGHVWGTITPYSAAFAPPPKHSITNNNNNNNNNTESGLLNQELQSVFRKKNGDYNDDTQSLQSSSTNEPSSPPPSANLHLYHYPPLFVQENQRKRSPSNRNDKFYGNW